MAALPRLRNLVPEVEQRIHAALQAERARTALNKGGRLALSQIGDCERNLWAGLHGIPEAPIDGRVLVLFEHGNAAESHIVSLLKLAGYEVSDRREDGEQHRVVDFMVNSEPGMSGRMDGFIRVSQRNPRWDLLEIKSANGRQFEMLQTLGFADWQPKYVAQVQMGMGYSREQLPFGDIEHALCVVECKNDSRLHVERIRFDESAFCAMKKKARKIIEAHEPLPRPNQATSKSCQFCKWCSRNTWCWSSTADVQFDGDEA